MLIISILLSMPILILLARVFLVKYKGAWGQVDGKVVNFFVEKKHESSFSKGMDDPFNNYISISYEYSVSGKKYISNRKSLDLLERGYRLLEIEHDPYINKLKELDEFKVSYLILWPKISVIENKDEHIYSNLVLLSIYTLTIVISYVVIILIS
nr:hypothetical protein [uncultured Desulfuromonas sp.]